MGYWNTGAWTIELLYDLNPKHGGYSAQVVIGGSRYQVLNDTSDHGCFDEYKDLALAAGRLAQIMFESEKTHDGQGWRLEMV